MLIKRETIEKAFFGAQFLGDVDQWTNIFFGQELIPFVDSRVSQLNGLFVALQGEHVDGHQYLSQAIESGAIALLIDKNKNCFYDSLEKEVKEKLLCIIVDDSLFALVAAAKWWRSLLTMPIVGITGSMGKTSTKELIGHIFRANNKKIALTSGNQNSLIGLSISILKTELTDQFAIFEMGINEVGEMDQLVQLARPTTALLTGLAHAHTEGLTDFATLISEKEKIFSELNQNQIGIVHEKYLSLLSKNQQHQWFIVGITNKADLWFKQKEVKIEGEERLFSGLIHFNKESIEFSFKELAPGRLDHILLSVAVAVLHGISFIDACNSIASFSLVKGRFQKNALPGGKGIVIDDACNANPETMIASITFFEEMETDLDKILVLGQMLELGAYEKEGHNIVLKKVASCKKIKRVILIGPLFKELQKSFLFHSEIFCFVERQEAFDFISQLENKLNSIILLKSSKSIGLSLLVPLFLGQKTQLES